MVATDNGFPRLSTSVRVTVTVVRNRFGPVFQQDVYEESISESTPAGTRILTVLATEQEGVRTRCGPLVFTILNIIKIMQGSIADAKF